MEKSEDPESAVTESEGETFVNLPSKCMLDTFTGRCDAIGVSVDVTMIASAGQSFDLSFC
jgi:hypothetical protein